MIKKPFKSNYSRIPKEQFMDWTDSLLIATKKQFENMPIDHIHHLDYRINDSKVPDFYLFTQFLRCDGKTFLFQKQSIL